MRHSLRHRVYKVSQPQKRPVTWTNDILVQCFRNSKPMEKELTIAEMDGPSRGAHFYGQCSYQNIVASGSSDAHL